ncbi:putative polyketide synthase [Aspergillus sclerotioniger CBS 115572]|uniref:Putative polyketide synthase n=1 Tax=Aspergillus sclerotioniger CBS 115572 TaxID=1450535 RepID=A0A317XE39_9EURO|nr:putative polyketide synthase [Aspergillus sclerotioniger CBS 115572]PWY95188.1 putative polyketide synthase [Aspergillus sclerotioniger CBS 115572]
MIPVSSPDIAIIGMSCRVAGANSPSELWNVLASSKDVRTEISRFNSDGFYKPDGGPRKGLTNVRHAYVMPDGVDKFDNTFFKISPLEAEAMDPQQRLLLELTYEAIENAGVTLDEFEGSDTAVYAGIFGNDYHTSLLRDVDATPKYMSTGTSNSIAANRISYVFDLHGPSLVIDTACSSTMVALHQAVAGLKAGESSMAVVCGANLIISPDMFVHMSELGFLSPSGRCQSFDAAGDGYARGEGVMAILLKPLNEALQNGDPIRAVIRGTRINQDGRTQGISLPSSEAQRQNLFSLYKQLELDPGGVQYIEAHGTGTAVGDPLEMSAIDAVFGDSHSVDKLIVGSVKSSIGHLESCAALVGIIKTVEALERATIPPQMLFRTPNPKINFDRISIPTNLTTWPTSTDGSRRAGVNSFGFGGTNGHAVLEAFDSTHAASRILDENRPYLFKVSAANTSSLVGLSKSIADYVERERPALCDLSHTLLSRRSNLRKLAFIVASSHDELVSKLRVEPQELVRSNTANKKVAFIFTGQGAQWQMGKQLLGTSPLFRSVITDCDNVLQSLPDAPSWKIAEELVKSKEKSRLARASFSQPMCTALQIGLVEILRSWGISPNGVVGHSSGEIGAAYAAGFLSLRDAITIAFYRGLYLGENAPVKRDGPAGAMCAIGLGEADCANMLERYQGKVVLAAVNSPSSCTLSGDVDGIQKIVAECTENGTFCRALRVDMAYHSHHMLPLAPAYENAMNAAHVQPLSGNPTTCEMFSSVTRQKVTSGDCVPSYWRDNMVSCVRFLDALGQLATNVNPDVFFEIGPHPALKGPVGDVLSSMGKTEYQYFHSCFRGQPDHEAMLNTAGSMIAANLPVLASRVNAAQTCHGLKSTYTTGRVLTDLPTYHWDHSTGFWAESRLSKNVRERRFPRHQLLGTRFHNDMPLAPRWRNVFCLQDLGDIAHTLTDRSFYGSVAITLSMILEAARQIFIENQLDMPLVRLQDIAFQHPIPFPEDPEAPMEIHLVIHQDTATSGWRLEIFSARSQSEMTWVKNCTSRLSFSRDETTLPESTECQHDEDKLEYALSFGTMQHPDLDDFSFNKDSAYGRFSNPVLGYENYKVDPAILSTVLQLPELVLQASGLPAAYQLLEIGTLELDITMPAIEKGSFQVTFPTRGTTGGKAELAVYGESGHGLVVRGMSLQRQKVIQKDPILKSLFYKSHLQPDIIRLSSTSALHIKRVTELVTGKWPMCDVGIINLDSTTTATLLSGLQGMESHQRPKFRSLTIVGDHSVKQSDRVRTLDGLDGSLKLHCLIGKACDVRSSTSNLLQNGVVCALLEDHEDEAFFSETFDSICDVTGLDEKTWRLGRLKPHANGTLVPDNVKVIAPFDIISAPSVANASPKFEGILLETQTLKQWTSANASTDSFDAIIVDSADKSILVDWKGAQILPWLQFVVDHVKVLLWVSIADGLGNLSGSLLKTLQSEYPSVRFATLIFKGEKDMDFITRTTLALYDDIIHGDREIQYVVQDRRFHILRYQPDDELSASVGIIPPVQEAAKRSPQLSIHQLTLSGPRSTLLLSERAGIDVGRQQNTYRVVVDTSVVDLADTYRFNNRSLLDSPHLGRFFAGRAYSAFGSDSSFIRVVGWHTNAHQSVLDLPASQVFPIPEGTSVVDAVVQYAAFTTAATVLGDIARCRRGDRLYIRVAGVLGEALTATAKLLGVTVVSEARSTDIVIEYASERGLLLNGGPVCLQKLSATNAFHNSVASRLGPRLALNSVVSTFNIKDHQVAFERAVEQPFAVVLSHSEHDDLGNAITWYPSKKPLFRDDGAYIIIGGSGGLGQYLCSWMIQNGAKNLYILSRRGILAPGAHETVEAIERLHGHLEVLSADATDSSAVQEALESIRQVIPIRGCLNLAMILKNSPFSTMTDEQWDDVLRVKVDTTWNLHQHTLQDDLDFFIMFSSISSICGNRAQANYATGNAFLNSMAEYRHGLGLPGTAVALGAMSGIGVLANNEELLRILRQSGLDIVDAKGLEKVMEAAILSSQSRDHATITVGLQMFETLDGKVQAESDQTQIFWTEWPEFACLMDHKASGSGAAAELSLLDQVLALDSDAALGALLKGFRVCLSNITGQHESSFDPASPLSMYGLDSLNAVGVRYWFFKEIGVDLPVFDVLGCTSINALLARAYQKLEGQKSATEAIKIPQPVAHTEVAVRPLSHSQQRLWFLYRFLSDKTVYNLLLVCHIIGCVDATKFATAWTVLMERHEVLRSKIVDTADGLQQIPISERAFPLTVVETSDEDFQQREEALTQIARVHNFDVEGGELIRGWLLRSPTKARFFLASNHLAWDRSSVPTIFSETSAIYKFLLAGEQPEEQLQPVPFQFIDYTLWQNDWLNQEALTAPMISYWEKKLAGVPQAVSLLPFALKEQRPSMKVYEVGRVQHILDAELATSIKNFCKRHAVTPFMFVTSALGAVLSRLTGDEDVVIGITDGDRGHSAFDQLIGFTVNMLPLRSHITRHMPYMTFLEQFRTTCLEAYEHHAVPFDYLLQKLNISRSTSHSPVFQITVNYQVQGGFPEVDFGEFKFAEYDHYNARSQSDIALEVEELGTGELLCGWDFDSSLYDEAGVLELVEMYHLFIQDVIEKDGAGQIEDFQLVSSADKARIASALQPSYEDEPSLEQLNQSLFPVLFAAAVGENPNKTALIDCHGSLSYSELKARTNAVANTLLDNGARMGDRIGICCEQSNSLVIAVYGILRAGCVYVPIDPDFPAERISWMIEDVGISKILVDDLGDKKSQQILMCGFELEHLYEVEKVSQESSRMETPVLPREIEPSDNFCCIFTSGSTGRPKGVYIGHAQLRYQMHGYNKYIGTSSDDLILLASAMVFDMSLPAIFGTIQYGATMFVASREARYSAIEMISTLITRQITNCIFTPTQVKVMLQAPNKKDLSLWTSLRRLVLGGESVSTHLVRDFFALELPQARFFNGYAPSETTVVNTLKELFPEDAGRSDIPLNVPFFPARLYILDEEMRPAPFGVPGELYIGGPNVNRGYVNRPEITAKAFLDDPFAPESEIQAGFGKLYRTGDAFCLSRDGTVRALGRIGSDRQVKIRSMRVELQEIENAIWSAYEVLQEEGAPSLSLVAVTYHRKGELDGLLAAYLAPSGSVEVSDDEQRHLTGYLRLALKATLPVHMLPAAYVFVRDLPRTITGKIDHLAISSWQAPTVNAANGVSSHENLSETESIVASVWKSVLHIGEALGPADDLFALGGHSLILLQIQSEIADKCGVTISLAEMFANPSLREMGYLLAQYQRGDYDGHSKEAISDEHEPSATIDWQKETLLPGPTWTVASSEAANPAAIVVTGATTMIGAHFVHLMLASSTVNVHCIGVQATSEHEARASVLSTFSKWNLLDVSSAALDERLYVYRGSLSHPTLGLSDDIVRHLDEQADQVYHFDSDVSLLKNYEALRPTNIGSLHFLIDLARGSSGKVKPLHYLSSWGVPHLQSWASSSLSNQGYIDGEKELTNLTPGSENTLGYLKCRWVCEALLYEAAKRGLPVSIYRACMCGSAPLSGRGLDRTDINRRILEACLQTSLVPDFRSANGGGMSWISVDYLVQSIKHLSSDSTPGTTGQTRIFNYQAEKHIPYTQLPAVLGGDPADGGVSLAVVPPAEWFKGLRESHNPEMIMHAEVLEQWFDAGWTPFTLQGETSGRLVEVGLVAPTVTREFLLKQVVGTVGF